MKTIIFLNEKGGVGKTASATSVSHIMASKYGKRVLVVDTDPQMNSTMMFSQVNFTKIFDDICNGKSSENRMGIEKLMLDKNVDIHDCSIQIWISFQAVLHYQKPKT